MKTIKMFLAVLLTLPFQAFAQQHITIPADGLSLCVIPKAFTADSKAKIHSSNSNDDVDFIKVYNDDLAEIASIKYDTDEYLSYQNKTLENGKWVISSEYTDRIDWISLRFLDLKNGTMMADSDADILLTQTLFNDDEKFEYVKPKYKLVETRNEYDNNQDGVIDQIYSDWDIYYLGFDVVSEDGNIVYSLDFNTELRIVKESFDFVIVSWEDKTYIAIISEVDHETNCDMYLLKRDESGISLQKANNNGVMKLFPSVARKSSMVTVDLGNKLAENNGTLSVSDMNGKTVYTQRVESGITSTQIPINRLHSGLYIVSLNVEGNSYETAKLIVK